MGLKDRLQVVLVAGAVLGLVFDVFSNSSPWAGVRLAGNICFFAGLAMLVGASFREKRFRDAKAAADEAS